METEARPPLPPFAMDSATLKVRLTKDAWNSRDPAKVAMAVATLATHNHKGR